MAVNKIAMQQLSAAVYHLPVDRIIGSVVRSVLLATSVFLVVAVYSSSPFEKEKSISLAQRFSDNIASWTSLKVSSERALQIIVAGASLLTGVAYVGALYSLHRYTIISRTVLNVSTMSYAFWSYMCISRVRT